jgi:hypothetical protein
MEELSEIYGWKEGKDWRWLSGEATWHWLRTGSTTELYGADDKRFARILRGRQFDDVAVDEAQEFRFEDLGGICRKILMPTIADRRGRIFITGTPGDFDCFFKEVVWDRKHAEWAVVHGEYLENPATRSQLRGQIAMLEASNPGLLEEPWFRREYKNEWVSDVRRGVCKVPEVGFEAYEGPMPGDRHVIGASIGPDMQGALAVAVVGRCRKKPVIIFAEEHGRRKTREHDAALRALLLSYPGSVIAKACIESQAMLEDLVNAGIPIDFADKQNMPFMIDRLTGDVEAGAVLVSDVDAADPSLGKLARHWRDLVWIDSPQGGRTMSAAPHLTEAAALAVSGCFSSYVAPDTRDSGKKEEDRMRNAMIRRRKGESSWR